MGLFGKLWKSRFQPYSSDIYAYNMYLCMYVYNMYIIYNNPIYIIYIHIYIYMYISPKPTIQMYYILGVYNENKAFPPVSCYSCHFFPLTSRKWCYSFSIPSVVFTICLFIYFHVSF